MNLDIVFITPSGEGRLCRKITDHKTFTVVFIKPDNAYR